MSKTVKIDDFTIELTRKKIKRLNLRIKEPDGRIVISAPYGMSDREIILFVQSHRNWIIRNVAKVQQKAINHPEPVDAVEKERRRKDLRSRIEKRLPEIESITGLRSNGWTIRDMHTRWGSCNTRTHHINFSLMLATRNDVELDYVILHELVHTIVPNHGPDFYAEMDKFMPGWKQIRKSLRS